MKLLDFLMVARLNISGWNKGYAFSDERQKIHFLLGVPVVFQKAPE